jgi:hypothetical protein
VGNDTHASFIVSISFCCILKWNLLLEKTCISDFENAGDYFFSGQNTLWAISRDILKGPILFWPLSCPECSEGQFRGIYKRQTFICPPANVTNSFQDYPARVAIKIWLLLPFVEKALSPPPHPEKMTKRVPCLSLFCNIIISCPVLWRGIIKSKTYCIRFITF